MQKYKPLVSVLIPCYNVSPFVEKAIASILAQTYSNLEVWVIDDASTDDTLQKIKAIKDERIVIKTFKKNTQKVGAVNDVLGLVKGDYICFQDADDWSESNRIEEQLKQFGYDPDLGICFTGYSFAGAQKTSVGKISLTNESLQKEFLEFSIHSKEEGQLPTLCATMMINKAVLEKTIGYHTYFAGRVAEDIQWVYRILKEFKGITINHPLYVYTSREGSFSYIQASGKNAKYAYSWQLLSKIIYKDIHEDIDVLSSWNGELLKKLELEACEEVLMETTQQLNKTRNIYENSTSYKLGKLILYPWRLIKSLIK